jgi:hypothetical protein
MKGSIADGIRELLKRGVEEEKLQKILDSKAKKRAFQYFKETGRIKVIDSKVFYVENKEKKIDKVWKAMKYLKTFKIKDIVQMTGWDKRKIGVVLTEFIRAGIVRKEIGKNKKDVTYIVLAEERPPLKGGKKYVRRKKQG